jgi:hypothetical protein
MKRSHASIRGMTREEHAARAARARTIAAAMPRLEACALIARPLAAAAMLACTARAARVIEHRALKPTPEDLIAV